MRKVLIVFLIFALAGCVYSNTHMIDDRTAIVTARGNAFASMAQVRQQVFIEAAEITLEKGYDYFYIAVASDTSSSGVYTTPSSTSFSGRVNQDYFGSSFYGSSTTTPGQSLTYVKPGQEVGIKMYRASEITSETRTSVWDARSILGAREQE